MLRQRGPRVGWHGLLVAGLLLLSLTGCRALSTNSLKPLPLRERFGNPWSPESYARREAHGTEMRVTPEMEEWAAFACHWLQEGDIVLRRARSCKIPAFDISRMLADVADSPFSHLGVICREGDHFFVYDTESSGPHKVPFENWMLDVTDNIFCLKRIKEPYRDRIPQILAYCEKVYQEQVPFDRVFLLDDRALYCAEMVEKAFLTAGLTLSKPVPLCCYPNYERYRCLAELLQCLTELRVTEPVWSPGNDTYGIYASPLLETVYETPEARDPKWSSQKPPTCPPVDVHWEPPCAKAG